MEIYKIVNRVNNKIYIGKDESSTPSYMGSGKLIKRAHEKYGLENFTKTVIETCEDRETLCEREKYWIQYYNSTDLEIGYNITSGGDGGDTYSNLPEEQMNEIRQKLSEVMKKRVFSEEHRRKLSEAGKGNTNGRLNKGIKRTEEQKEKLSKIAKDQWKRQKEEGYVTTEEHRRKQSEAAKKRWAKRKEQGFKSLGDRPRNQYI